MEPEIQELRKLSTLINTKSIMTSTEVEAILKGIFNILQEYKKGTAELNADTRSAVEQVLSAVVDKHVEMTHHAVAHLDLRHASIHKTFEDHIGTINSLLQEAKDKIPKDGEPGKDADAQEIIAEVMKLIKLPEYEVVAELSGAQIANKLEDMEESEKLSAYALEEESLVKRVRSIIKNRKEIIRVIHEVAVGGARFLANLQDIVLNSPTDGQVLTYDAAQGKWKNANGGGGGSASFVDNEIVTRTTPTTYTLANAPVAGSVHVYGGGSRLYVGTDYTISGTVITTLYDYGVGGVLADYRK